MEVIGDYHADGYAHLRGLISPQLARAVLKVIRQNVMPGSIPLHVVNEYSGVLKRPALEIDGYQFAPLLFFLWGMTPMVSRLVGREVVRQLCVRGAKAYAHVRPDSKKLDEWKQTFGAMGAVEDADGEKKRTG